MKNTRKIILFLSLLAISSIFINETYALRGIVYKPSITIDRTIKWVSIILYTLIILMGVRKIIRNMLKHNKVESKVKKKNHRIRVIRIIIHTIAGLLIIFLLSILFNWMIEILSLTN